MKYILFFLILILGLISINFTSGFTSLGISAGLVDTINNTYFDNNNTQQFTIFQNASNGNYFDGHMYLTDKSVCLDLDCKIVLGSLIEGSNKYLYLNSNGGTILLFRGGLRISTLLYPVLDNSLSIGNETHRFSYGWFVDLNASNSIWSRNITANEFYFDNNTNIKDIFPAEDTTNTTWPALGGNLINNTFDFIQFLETNASFGHFEQNLTVGTGPDYLNFSGDGKIDAQLYLNTTQFCYLNGTCIRDLFAAEDTNTQNNTYFDNNNTDIGTSFRNATNGHYFDSNLTVTDSILIHNSSYRIFVNGTGALVIRGI